MKAGGKIYHKSCFCCFICSKELDSKNCEESEGKLWCMDCFTNDINIDEDFNPYSLAKECPKCNLTISSGKVEALGFYWHPKCFICFKCNKKLASEYEEFKGKPYCDRCIVIVRPPHQIKTKISNKGFSFNR
eukprot:TRINITY_DN3638_c0_g1_i1.p2 TRINITY_DN3638_c0_g1~~TRINITY_DN3638_c0_g1_i1.p2  ORF type:complete len:132 (-),score=22.50 TRINITY_DN3638_c0_g1_i1:644-1039(-)